MGFLRRILGGTSEAAADPGPARDAAADGTAAPNATTAAANPSDDEATRDRDLLRAESERLSDDLLARQLRYADRSWTPPAQGGTRRADDGEGGDG